MCEISALLVQALDVLAGLALAVARGPQLAFVGPALARVEHGGPHHLRLARRVGDQHGVDQHGQPLAVGGDDVDGDLADEPCMRSSGA